MSTPKVIYALDCNHASTGPADLVTGFLPCPWHQGMRRIVGVITHEWRAKCNTCRYARWAGLSEQTADIFANGHASRNPQHQVYIEYLANPESEKTLAKQGAWNGHAHTA